MATTTPDIGQGIAVAMNYGAGSITGLNLLDVRWAGATRNTHNGKHLGTTDAQPFLASKSWDAGEVSLTMQFDTDESKFLTAIDSNTLGTLTITWPDGNTLALRAWCTSFEVEAGEDVMTATGRFKLGTSVAINGIPG